MNAPFDATHALHLACSTLEIEAAAVQALKSRLGAEFVRAVQLVLAAGGHVAVMGMGKSGHVGRKLAATLASTGTPAIFVHPAEASHGDLGMIRPQDVVLAISNSGESEEITRLLPLIKRLGTPPLIERLGTLERGRRVGGRPCDHALGLLARICAQFLLKPSFLVFHGYFCSRIFTPTAS